MTLIGFLATVALSQSFSIAEIGERVRWVADYGVGVDMARSQRLPTAIIVTQSRGDASRPSVEVLMDPKLAEPMRGFVAIQANMESMSAQVREQLDLTWAPSFVFLDRDGRMVWRTTGVGFAEEMAYAARKARWCIETGPEFANGVPPMASGTDYARYAHVLAGRGLRVEAQQALEQAELRGADPKEVKHAHFALGEFHRYRQEFAESVPHYRASLSDSEPKGSFYTLIRIASSCYRLNKLDEAQRAVNQALEIPDLAEAEIERAKWLGGRIASWSAR